MKENIRENLKNAKENLKPLLDQIKGKLNDEQVRETLLKNFAQTRATLEATAKEVVRQTKESRLVHDYVRPALESDKTEQALNSIEAKLAQAAPLVAKLREYRKQFLDATKPGEEAKAKAKTPRKKKSAKSADAQSKAD